MSYPFEDLPAAAQHNAKAAMTFGLLIGSIVGFFAGFGMAWALAL